MLIFNAHNFLVTQSRHLHPFYSSIIHMHERLRKKLSPVAKVIISPLKAIPILWLKFNTFSLPHTKAKTFFENVSLLHLSVGLLKWKNYRYLNLKNRIVAL